jgi:threonine aldolase
VLAGNESFVERARRTRKLLGGGMRQAGLLAAPGLLALENVDRLAQDHERAERLASALDDLEGLAAPTPDTNIVLVDTTGTGLTAAEFLDHCADAGLQGTEFGESTARFCTHLDVDDEDVTRAIDVVETVLEATD